MINIEIREVDTKGLLVYGVEVQAFHSGGRGVERVGFYEKLALTLVYKSCLKMYYFREFEQKLSNNVKTFHIHVYNI